MKKVALEISGLLGVQSGVSVYLRELLGRLPSVSDRIEYALYGCFWQDFARRIQELQIPEPENYELLFRRLPQRLLLPLEYRLGIPIEEGFLRRRGVDLFHATGQLLPVLRDIKTILTVHQEPDRTAFAADAREHFELTNVFPQAVRSASHLIAVSHATRHFLRDEFGIPDERITVIHHAPPDIELSEEDEKRYRSWAERFGLRLPYVLSVAHLNPRKNILVLLDAFRRFLDQTGGSAQLVLVGRSDTPYTQQVRQQISKLGLTGQVILGGEIRDRALVGELYRHALMLGFPSLTESFGIPVIEAMKFGCPVVASDIPVMPEIAGEAALFVPPRDPEAIAAAMVRISADSALRADLISKGRARAKLFDWRTAAAATVDVYEKVLSKL